MVFPPRRIVAPAVLPVSLGEAKAHLRYEDDDQDALIEAQIKSAVGWLDGYSGILGRCLIHQRWELPLIGWGGIIGLPFPDCSDVVVSYRDPAGAWQLVPDADLTEPVEMHGGTIVSYLPTFSPPALANTLAPAIKVSFKAGFGPAPEDVPPALREAILIMVGDWFRNRETAAFGTINPVPVVANARALIAPWRRKWL